MKTDFVIYCIEIKGSDKKYIGQTCRWNRRPQEHKRQLKKGKHHSALLQRSYNKYGKEESFSIGAIDSACSQEEANEKEQYWIGFFDSANPDKGYNIVPIIGPGTNGYKHTEECKQIMSKLKKGTRNKGRAGRGLDNYLAKEYILFSPEGIETKIKNLREFARNNNLDYGRIHSVAIGRVIEYSGWKLSLERKHNKIKTWTVISPDGERMTFENLRQFCLEKNLPYRSMGNMCNGRHSACKGWTSEHSWKRRGINAKMQSPQGEIIEINNVRLFCEENDIRKGILKKGETARGWTRLS